jgi:exonuclease 3'-5' domain-containing protein 1
VSGQTLKAILESPSYAKVFFDVRNDSDALFSHYGISLYGVIDLQVLEFVTRTGPNLPRLLHGLSKCISHSGILSVQEARLWEQAKADGVRQFAPERGGTYDVFLSRPLSAVMQKYCAEDVLHMPPLLLHYGSQIRRYDSRHEGQISRLLAGEVEKEVLARVSSSQSPSYIPHGQHKALGPTLSWTR